MKIMNFASIVLLSTNAFFIPLKRSVRSKLKFELQWYCDTAEMISVSKTKNSVTDIFQLSPTDCFLLDSQPKLNVSTKTERVI